jgi:hypothetical protein
MKDLHNNIEVTSLLHAIAVATTQTITDIDLAGCNSAELVIDAGADGGGVGLDTSNKIVFTLKHSDDGTTYAAVEDKDMLGVSDITSGTILTIDGTDEDDTVYHFGYIGGKRYLELAGTVTGTISIPFSISLVKGHLQDSPVI